MKWTDEQKQAIDIRGGKILVAAGAGSGKTAVLVQRIINKVIEEKVDIDKLLVVTFTNAAASEMRERILKAIYDNLEEHPELERQILLLNKASITTIDAFCKKVLQDNFFDESISLDPNFKVCDNTENELLKLEALDEIMEELYEEANEVVELFSTNKSDNDFREIILKIHTFISSNPYPLKWLDDKCELYNVESDDFAKTIWGAYLVYMAKDTFRETLKYIEEKLDELYKIGGLAKYCGFLEYDVTFLKECKECYTWNSLFNKLAEYNPSRWSKDKEVDEELSNRIRAFKDSMEKEIKDLKKETFIAKSEDIFKEIEYSYKNIKAICEVVKRFDARFKKKKQDKNLIDFSDMEHLCFELLTKNENIANQYKEKYEEILIDEYQDSNMMQEYILNSISRGNIFMVGDVKQSIYRFRQACPELFLDKYETYKNIEEGGHQRKILLFKNFRSNKNIIDQCNFIFSNIMSKELGEVRYDEAEYLKFGADYYENVGATAELHFLNKDVTLEDVEDETNNEEGKEEDSSDSLEEIDTEITLEARLVAKRIKEIVGNLDVYDKDKKQTRKATYKDIAILSRAVSGGVASAFVEELSFRGIPIFADVGEEYFSKVEMQVMMSLLKIIDNPYQDIPLVAVLRSKIGDFSGDELAEIRLVNRKVSFYEAMKFKAGQGDKKVLAFLDRLSMWREKSKYLNLGELLWMLYNETAYYEYVSCMPNGIQRKKNLDNLLDKAEKFDATSYKGLFNFIKFMDNQKKSSKDSSSAITLGENDNVVRLMTMHKSKGLEFPIVFLVNMGKGFNKQDSRKKIVMHKEDGMAIDVVDLEDRVKYTSLTKIAIKYVIESDQLSEEMRILYVAFTRAREKLIITSRVDSKTLAKWGDTTRGMFNLASAKSFMEWITRAVLQCKGKDKFEIHKWAYNEVADLFEDEEESIETFSKNIDKIFDATPEYKNIEETFNWKYKYDNSTKLPSKITVTELKRLWNEIKEEEKTNEQLIKAPELLTKEKRSGATFGTILHNIMQRFDFSSPDIDVMLQSVDKLYRSSIAPYLNQFLETELYQKIKSAINVWREMPFNLSLKLGDIYNIEDDSKEDEILVQGVIDLYFENEDGTLTLVDYKTDNLETADEFIKKYKVQLDYYKKALEKLTNKKVKDVIIYSFKLNKEIKL